MANIFLTQKWIRHFTWLMFSSEKLDATILNTILTETLLIWTGDACYSTK